jgi:hypothetical protein
MRERLPHMPSSGEHILRQCPPVRRPQRAKLGIMGVPIGTFESLPNRLRSLNGLLLVFVEFKLLSRGIFEGGVSIAGRLELCFWASTATFWPTDPQNAPAIMSILAQNDISPAIQAPARGIWPSMAIKGDMPTSALVWEFGKTCGSLIGRGILTREVESAKSAPNVPGTCGKLSSLRSGAPYISFGARVQRTTDG